MNCKKCDKEVDLVLEKGSYILHYMRHGMSHSESCDFVLENHTEYNP